MSNASYNRGSRALSREIDADMESLHAQGVHPTVAIEHPAPVVEAETKPPLCGYHSLVSDPDFIKVGERVFCTVSACQFWSTVTEVKGTRSNLRIKTDAMRGWGYGHNFTRKPPKWMVRESSNG